MAFPFFAIEREDRYGYLLEPSLLKGWLRFVVILEEKIGHANNLLRRDWWHLGEIPFITGLTPECEAVKEVRVPQAGLDGSTVAPEMNQPYYLWIHR